MAVPVLPLCYCSNVHAGATLQQARANLERFAPAVRDRFGQRMGVGLWLSQSALAQANSDESVARSWAEWLGNNDLICYTMNTFPFGDFHAERVKEMVYLPDWTTAERRDYTCQAAEFLAALLPAGVEGSLSTLPLAYKPVQPADREPADFFPRLIETANYLAQLADRTGKVIRVAIEPEPFCMIETSQEAVWFFESLRDHVAGTANAEPVRQHLGLCFDVCHQCVEFENVASSIAWLKREGVRIVKVQLSCGIELESPALEDARAKLAKFAEHKYLHQTFARRKDALILSETDLTVDFANNPTEEWKGAERWRTHFHVPIHLTEISGLKTTQTELVAAIEACKKLDPLPHFEVETYTWSVMEADGKIASDEQLIEGLAAEMRFAASCFQ